MIPLPPAAGAVFVAALGLAIGSFLNVVIYRLPRGLSLAFPPSHCPACRTPIRWYDNVPVLGWIALGGRCRACRAAIPVKYPLVEAATAAVFVLLWWQLGWQPLLAVRLAFAAALVALFMIDLEHQILPNPITLGGIVSGVAASVFLPPGLVSSLLGVAVGGGLLWIVAEGYFRWRGIDGLGMGDVKMLAMVGAVLGWPAALLTLVFGSIAGALLGVALIAARRGTMQLKLPFGTFLAVGALVAAVWGEPIIAWYLGLQP